MIIHLSDTYEDRSNIQCSAKATYISSSLNRGTGAKEALVNVCMCVFSPFYPIKQYPSFRNVYYSIDWSTQMRQRTK